MGGKVTLYTGRGKEGEAVGVLDQEPLVVGKTVFALQEHSDDPDQLFTDEHAAVVSVYTVGRPKGFIGLFKPAELQYRGKVRVAEGTTFEFPVSGDIFSIVHEDGGDQWRYTAFGNLVR
ncbi:hypothetical protein HY950_01965 [Candidatus Gottesmanbacteria bacterium]|nr:hypothetical protein [Candidatus Gottesmanbacteria bacterium]